MRGCDDRLDYLAARKIVENNEGYRKCQRGSGYSLPNNGPSPWKGLALRIFVAGHYQDEWQAYE